MKNRKDFKLRFSIKFMAQENYRTLETYSPITLYKPGVVSRAAEKVREIRKDLGRIVGPVYQRVLRKARGYKERN